MTTPQSVIDRYTAAGTALDSEALLALYHPELRMFDLMLPWQIRGKDAWRKGVDTWFTSIGENPTVKASDVEIHETDGMALVTCTMTYAHVENGKPFSMPNRFTWVLVPEGDDWRILHEHTSVPLSNDEHMTPILDPTA